MPSPQSPITTLGKALAGAPSLKAFARVLTGKNYIAAGRAPPSIVIYPVSGPLSQAIDVPESFNDVELNVAARLWGRTIDEVWDLRARYIAALWYQANPDPENPDDSIAGPYFKLIDEVWDIEPDTDQQGQEIEVIAMFRFTASEKSLSYGEVDSVDQSKTATLTVAMLAGDTTANVDATAGNYPATGVLHIDGEQMSYSGLTATSFTGLSRGINGTTAAAHAIGATVSVTPT